MVMVVEVEEDGASARVALKGVHAPIAAVAHEVEAQLPGHSRLGAKGLHPLPDLQQPQIVEPAFLMMTNSTMLCWREATCAALLMSQILVCSIQCNPLSPCGEDCLRQDSPEAQCAALMMFRLSGTEHAVQSTASMC